MIKSQFHHEPEDISCGFRFRFEVALVCHQPDIHNCNMGSWLKFSVIFSVSNIFVITSERNVDMQISPFNYVTFINAFVSLASGLRIISQMYRNLIFCSLN